MMMIIMIAYLLFIAVVGICTFDSLRKENKPDFAAGVATLLVLFVGVFILF